MRVIAGSAKGRRLRSLPGREVRPTSDRIREALFSALADVVPGADVLDLFAGTGALGIEALSRGARSATFVDASPRATGVIAENLRRTGLDDHARVVRDDVARFCGHAPQRYGLVLADPPYRTSLDSVWRSLSALHRTGGMTPAAVLIVERDRRDPGLASAPPGVLAVDRQRRYGDTVLLFCRASTPCQGEP